MKTPLGRRLTALLDLDYPVFQGGMAWLGTAELAGAVSAAGGLGIIGAGNAPASWVAAQVRKVRAMTDRPFGVNILLVSPHALEVIELVRREGVPVVTTGAGNPGPHIGPLKEAGVRVIPVVSSVALAVRLVRAGADAVIAEGSEAGGHIGETSTMALVPQVVDAVGGSVPVVAAGGIADGRGLAAALALGADGVQVGTRFICAVECVAHPAYKETVLKAGDRATAVTGRSTGHPVRAIRNRLTREYERLEARGASPTELEEFGMGRYRAAALEGDVARGTVLAGQAAGLVRSVEPAAAIVSGLVREGEAVLRRLGETGGTIK
ncbi:MAG TPA: enoyl-[acyl-carrier-protein] reductase FabK [Clostridiales bacterium]|nr:enoyl-[acyl-carrier-protein] reductase FabK [Clostridiales bacterium]